MNPESLLSNFRGSLCLQRKKHDYTKLLKYTYIMDEGYSIYYFNIRYVQWKVINTHHHT